MSSASTPNRFAGRPTGAGYYANPGSPIASTPQRAPAKTPKAVPQTPSMAALSPMKQPTERALQRHDLHQQPEPVATDGKSWTNVIFSPVLKFFGSDEEKAAQEAAGAGSSLANLHAPDVAVPVLSPAPAPRKPGDHVMATSPTVGVASSSAASYSRSAGAGSSSSSSATGAGGSVASLAARTAASLNLYGSNGDGNSDTVMAGAAAASGSSLTQLSAPSSSSSSAVTPSRPTAGANITSPAAQASAAAAAAAQAAAQAAAAAEANSGEDEYEYEYEEFNPYLFIKLLPPYHTVAPKTPRIVLPKKSKKAPDVNLVLDLDETLVHCSVDPIPDADVTFPVTFNGMHYMVYVRKRPFLDRFFQSIAGKFEVTVFTASQQVYAERLLNLLDPEGIYIHHRLYRDSCLNVDGNYLKDLNVLGRDLSKTVLVDNSPHAFGYQLDNGIPIESWFDDRGDTELLKLSAFLHQLLGQGDVRPFVRDKFRVHRLVDEAR